MSTGPCAACGHPIVRAWISGSVERTFDATAIADGEWGLWHRQEGLHTIARARLHTPENHFGTTGHALHACPGAVGQQLELGAA